MFLTIGQTMLFDQWSKDDLENWFDQKERKIAQLTTHLKEVLYAATVCKEMAELNQTAREGISARE
eukprot:2580324-Rhodomonas_salina.1